MSSEQKFSLSVLNVLIHFSGRTYVPFCPKLEVLITYFIENQKQSNSFSLLTLRKQKHIKQHSVLSFY